MRPLCSGRASIPHLVAFAALLAFADQRASAQVEIVIPAGDECATCHFDLDEMPGDFQPYDVHFKHGLSCVGCHGGDASSDDEEVAMDEDAGFLGVPSTKDIPAYCGRCHSDLEYMRTFQPAIRTDQESQYHTSGHGRSLAGGDGKVATCVSCHTAHAILPASDTRSTVYARNVPNTCNHCHGNDEYMAGYQLRTGVYDAFAISVHGKALLEAGDVGAPACNDCHGNHGALPPDVASLAEVCGTCHPNNQRFFEESPMAVPFAEEELHSCIECHGQHEILDPTDEMVGVGDESVCLDCHAEGDKGYAAADSIYRHLEGLVLASDSAISVKSEVVRIGMDDVDIEYLLRDAHQSLIQARTLVHTFDPAKVGEETAKGVVNAVAAIELSQSQIEEHSKRRWGFGLATVFISILVVALFLKLRDIERGRNAASIPGSHIDMES